MLIWEIKSIIIIYNYIFFFTIIYKNIYLFIIYSVFNWSYDQSKLNQESLNLFLFFLQNLQRISGYFKKIFFLN